MNKSRAFTLIELLVAIAITAIIIVFASQVLSHVTEAAGHGASTSEIIQSSRMIAEQLDDDFAQMVGPGGDGFLMIIQKRIDGVHMTEDDWDRDMSEGNFGGTLQYDRDVRADQIVFVRTRNSLEPMAPASDTSYSAGSQALHVKITYGHAERTDADGTTTANAVGGVGGGGQSANTEGLGVRDPATHEPRLNYFAADWIMARQAIFLDDSVTTSQAHFIDEPTVNPPRRAATWNARLHTGAGSGYAGSIPNAPAPRLRDHMPYMALSDVADMSLADIATDMTNGFIGTGGNQRPLLDYGYAWERLRVNPTPQPNFDSWRIAQMHPYFVANVSDIQIDFAGDYNGDGFIDTLASNVNDTDASGGPYNGEDYFFPAGTLIWYSSFPNRPGSTSFDSSLPATWQIPAAAGVLSTPPPAAPPMFDTLNPTTGVAPAGNKAIRDPDNDYPVVNGVEPIAPYNVNADSIYLFRPRGTDWPYLIRIRYRIHDSQAKTMDANGNLGRVFEQILRIPR